MSRANATDPTRLSIGSSSPYRARIDADRGSNATAAYKPVAYEEIPWFEPISRRMRVGIPSEKGQLAARELSAFRLDETLTFGRVAPTGIGDGPLGPGSKQFWVHSGPSHQSATSRHIEELMDNAPKGATPSDLSYPTHKLARRAMLRYPREQREEMAVLDYIMANTDRHWGNFRTGRNGEIVAIDHALTFPEYPDPIYGIRSDFVLDFLGAELSDEVMQKVRAVDTDRLRLALSDAGLSDLAISGALGRLEEIKANGAITGDAWPGPFNGAFVQARSTAPHSGGHT